MVSDEQLDEWRLASLKVRVTRDDIKENDIRGIVVAWDPETVIIRKPNRKVVKLSRHYRYQPSDAPR